MLARASRKGGVRKGGRCGVHPLVLFILFICKYIVIKPIIL